MRGEHLARCRATLPVVGREVRLLCSSTCSISPCSPDDEDGDNGDGPWCCCFFDDVDNVSVAVDDDDVHLDLLPVIHQHVHLSCCPWIHHTKS